MLEIGQTESLLGRVARECELLDHRLNARWAVHRGQSMNPFPETARCVVETGGRSDADCDGDRHRRNEKTADREVRQASVDE